MNQTTKVSHTRKSGSGLPKGAGSKLGKTSQVPSRREGSNMVRLSQTGLVNTSK